MIGPLKWDRNTRGKLGVAIEIQLSITPQMIINGNLIDLPGFQPILRFFIKEFRLAYPTEKLVWYLEDVIESYMLNVYPENEVLADKASDALAPALVEYLAPYIDHVRNHGLLEPEELPKNEGVFEKALEAQLLSYKQQMAEQLYSPNPIMQLIESKPFAPEPAGTNKSLHIGSYSADISVNDIPGFLKALAKKSTEGNK